MSRAATLLCLTAMLLAVPALQAQDCEDKDGDGHFTAPCGADCNDFDPNVHPGRMEDCFSAQDDDCDQRYNCLDIDCLRDADNDGQIAEPCGEDCDDSDPANRARNVEICDDGGDNDCDGLVDCADPDCASRPCDDGIFCTQDVCDGGQCRGVRDDSRCDDGVFCNGDEICSVVSDCQPGAAPCAPGQVCDEALDSCLDCVADPREPDDACGEARPTLVDGTLRNQLHSLCPAGDRDRLRFSVVLGDEYTFFTTGVVDTRLSIQSDDCGIPLASNDDCSAQDDNACLTWTASYTGDAVLLVDQGAGTLESPDSGPSEGSVRGEGDFEELGARPAGPPGPAAALGDYVLWYRSSGPSCVEDPWEPEDDACDGATPIEPTPTEAVRDHSICGPGDIDRFRFLGEAGKLYHFKSTGTTDTRAEVRAPGCGEILARNASCSGAPNFCLVFQPTVTAFYVLTVRGEEAHINGSYRLHYRILDDPAGCVEDVAEPDNTCIQARALQVSPTERTLARSVCPAGDLDGYRFNAAPGRIYAFSTTGATDTKGFVVDGDCRRILASSDACPGDPLNFCLRFEPESADSYVLAITGQRPGDRGDYVLHYGIEGCLDDAAEPDDACAAATPIEPAVGEQSRSHTLCPTGDDIDLFSFFATGGTTYRFRSLSSIDTAAAVLDDGCGGFLVKNDTCDGVDEDFCLVWTAPESGFYKVGVSGSGAGGPYDFLYEIDPDGPDSCLTDVWEPDGDCGTATRILPASEIRSVDAWLCPAGDRDHFVFDAQAGRTYRFWTTGATDTAGSVRGGGCERLAGNDDCDRPEDLNLCLTWTAPASGTYHLRVRGYSPQTTGAYTLLFRLLP